MGGKTREKKFQKNSKKLKKSGKGRLIPSFRKQKWSSGAIQSNGMLRTWGRRHWSKTAPGDSAPLGCRKRKLCTDLRRKCQQSLHYQSLSFSLGVRACVRACVYLSLSFFPFLSCFISQVFCLSLSFSLTHTHAFTRSLPFTHSHTRSRRCEWSIQYSNGVFSILVQCRFHIQTPSGLKKKTTRVFPVPTEEKAGLVSRSGARPEYFCTSRRSDSPGPQTSHKQVVFLYQRIPRFSLLPNIVFSSIQRLPNLARRIFIPIFLAHTQTFLSLSPSLFLFLSLAHTHTCTHTFECTHSLTFSLAHHLIHWFRV